MDFFVFISEQWLLSSLLVVLIYVFLFTEKIKGGKPISAHEATRLINAEKAVMVDVREAKDYNEGHIAGSLHIPVAKIDARMSELDKHKDGLVILACKMGQQASVVGKSLGKAGFQVRRLQGGITEWTNQGLPLVKKK